MASRFCLIPAILACLAFFSSACQQQSGSRQVPESKPDTAAPAAEAETQAEAETAAAAVQPAAEIPVPSPEPAAKASDVWCLPEYYRIDPVSGEVAEWGHKPVTPEFKKKNNI